jgi:allophanate hydrolase
VIRIEVPGFGSTVQDRGRHGHLRSGLTTSGPADPFAFRAAQRLVGNTDTDACIEVVGLPFAFRLDTSRVIAVTGREVAVTTRDRHAGWTAIFVRSGDLVRISGSERSRYTYVAVSGGITSEIVLGSRSAYPRVGIGAVLKQGDALPLGDPRRGAEDAGASVRFEYPDEVAALAGPHLERFDQQVVARFFATAFTASPQSDRQGLRLDGGAIAPRAGEILSCGVVAGAVQVPRGGQPIVLLADHGTTGGYPIIATVASADLGSVAQRAPGESVRFYRVDRDRARALGRERAARLETA